MKNTQMRLITSALALVASATFALAGEPTLKAGDPAPKLQTGKWIQGDPLTAFKEGKAYLVEFWATWCPPCRVSIPHLNEIHNKYKDQGLVVIGQDCFERDDALVAPFVKKMADKMTYRVALDDKASNDKGQMAKTWMEAAGRNGIPSAFLVDKKGIIAWIGHPMELKDSIIEDVLAGKFDVKKAADDSATRQKNEAQLRSVWEAISLAMQNKDWDAASAKLPEAEKLVPEDERDNINMVRMDIALGKKEYATAYQLASKVSDANKDNAVVQNQIAWRILTDDSIEQRDLKLAETLANRANDITKGNDAGVLDTLARSLFMQGKKERAIELENQALKLAESDQQEMLQKTLDSYKKGVLPKAQ